jgi:hypothetical protein
MFDWSIQGNGRFLKNEGFFCAATRQIAVEKPVKHPLDRLIPEDNYSRRF